MPTSIQALVNAELDAAYNKTAAPVLDQIRALSAENMPVSRALKRLDEKAAQLQDDEGRFEADDPELEQVFRANRQQFDTTAALIEAGSDAIQLGAVKIAVPAVTAKVFLTLSGAIIRNGGNPVSQAAVKIYVRLFANRNIPFNMPDIGDIVRAYTQTSAWQHRMEGWGEGYAAIVEKSVLVGVRNGWGPRRVAAHMRQLATGLPSSAAENITRTLQIHSYRQAALEMEKINGGFIQKKIRIAALDDRTCLSCIALHGTELKPGESVDDHYRGRCDVYYVTPNTPAVPEYMQADSKPGQRNFVPFQNGPEWFASLPESRQKQQRSFAASPAKFRAFKDGTALAEFVAEHQDEVFGPMVVEQSLISALGDKAKDYYSINQ